MILGHRPTFQISEEILIGSHSPPSDRQFRSLKAAFHQGPHPSSLRPPAPSTCVTVKLHYRCHYQERAGIEPTMTPPRRRQSAARRGRRCMFKPGTNPPPPRRRRSAARRQGRRFMFKTGRRRLRRLRRPRLTRSPPCRHRLPRPSPSLHHAGDALAVVPARVEAGE